MFLAEPNLLVEDEFAIKLYFNCAICVVLEWRRLYKVQKDWPTLFQEDGPTCVTVSQNIYNHKFQEISTRIHATV